jgi:photosystem II stability/assembly factor-like uncharacterized protein
MQKSASLTLAALLAAAAFPAHAGLDPDRLAGLRARNVGPAGMSGRVAAIEGVAGEPDTVYVGAATGGLWRTTSGGVTWEPLFDDQPVHAIGAIAVHPANADLVWVGTGEANVRNSASVGNGVYLSRDRGKTWKHLGLDKSERIHRIRLHPTDTSTAWVCATGPEWGETSERGVYRTSDAGRNWKRVLFVDDKTGCADIATHPAYPDRLIASMWQFRRWPWHFKSGGPGSGLYVSHDGGDSWRKLQEEDGLPKGELGRIGLAVAPSSPDVAYAIVEAETAALLRSDDGGRTWSKVNEKLSMAPRPFYFNELRVDPQDPNRVYSVEYVVKVSTDGGRNFKTLPGASWSTIHGDHHALWIAPHDPNLMYFGNDGGVGISHDRGQTSRFVPNLPLAQFYHVALDDETPYNIYGGLQDNGSWRGPSAVWQQGGVRNHAWVTVGGGDGFETLPHPKDATVGYSESQGGELMRWDLKTGETRHIKPPPHPQGTKLRYNWNAALSTDPFEPDTVYLGSQFVHRSRDRGETWEILSPDLTTNNPEWQKQDTSGGLTIDATGAENFTTLVSIAPSPVKQGVIWTGSDDGRIHVTQDGGATWTSVEGGLKGVPAGTWVPHVEPSRFDAGTAFVVLDNHRRTDWTPYVYRTDDFGRTWRSLATPELRGYALAIRQDVVAKDLLFLGTEFALYFSNDGGRSWTHLKKTIPTASVHDLAVHPREHDLVIGTHGRALWILDDIRPLRALTAKALDEPLKLYEVGPVQQYQQRAEDGGFGFGTGEFRGQNEPYGAILTYSLNLPGLPVHDQEKERERKEKERQAARSAGEEAVARRLAESKPQPGATAPPAATTGASAEDAAAKEKPEDKPQVDVKVADAAGRTIRTFKVPARLGVNRATWNLRRDAFRQTPEDPEEPTEADEEPPSGPEVPPGTYTVSMSFRGHTATQQVTVRPDPRYRNSPADWQARWDAVLKAGELNDRAVAAILRVRRTREDVKLVQARAKAAAEDAGEKDKKKLAELPVVKAGDKVLKGLTALEQKLWHAPEEKGILPDTDALTPIGYAQWYLADSWEAPSPTMLAHLARAERRLAETLPEVDRFFAAEVEPFRKQAADGIPLLGHR